MPQKIQYCRCRVNLAGQNCHIVGYDETNAVTWPEVQILMQLHGEENVMDIMPIGIGETYPTAEKNRLLDLYGARVVETVFPGRNFRMEYMMTDEENLPRYEDGKPVRREDYPLSEQGQPKDELPSPLSLAEPVFKPGRNKPPTPPAAA